MDQNSLKTFSYIADINISLVLMARRRYRPSTGSCDAICIKGAHAHSCCHPVNGNYTIGKNY
eukprot:m.164310 g.164310  ORF g.164310 m.164310 type:complete len:62 (+) comp38871_c0_seq3:258-443(+)